MASKHLVPDGEESEDQNIRIVLVGKTGAGKSASGNTILQEKVFVSKPSLSSVTEKCQKETGEFEGQHLGVIDTPGLFDTKKPEKDLVEELAKCICMSAPGPHVFLVVIQPNRFTEEEQRTVQLIQNIFGRRASDYTMVLFTHGDDLEEDGMSVEELVKTNEKVSSFISQCGGRYHLFNNRSKDPSQVRELLEKIHAMVERNGGRYYNNEMFEEAQKAVKRKMILLRENQHLEIHEARRMAELNNEFIGNLLRSIYEGAVAGAECGAMLGPGWAVGGAVLVGFIAAVRRMRQEDPPI